jgi:hypothetical protein
VTEPQRKSQRRLIYAVVMLGVASILNSLLAIGYSNHVGEQSYQRSRELQRQICGMVVQLDDAQRQTPPPTQRARDFAKALHDYRVKLGC